MDHHLSPLEIGRGGEGWAVEDSTGARAHPGKASKVAFGQPKCSGAEREVATRRRALGEGGSCARASRDTFRKGKGDALVSSRVPRAWKTTKPCIPSPTRSKMRNDPSCSQTAARSTQPLYFEGSCIQGFEELKLRHK